MDARSMRAWHRPLMFFAAAMAVLAVVAAVGTSCSTTASCRARRSGSSRSSSRCRSCCTARPWPGCSPCCRAAAGLGRVGRHRHRRGGGASRWWSIVGQVVRGQTSHFNASTPLDTALCSVMGAAIVVLFVAHLVIGDRGAAPADRRPASPPTPCARGSACPCSACWRRCRWRCRRGQPPAIERHRRRAQRRRARRRARAAARRLEHHRRRPADRALRRAARPAGAADAGDPADPVRGAGCDERTRVRLLVGGGRRVRRTHRAADLAGPARPAAAAAGRRSRSAAVAALVVATATATGAGAGPRDVGRNWRWPHDRGAVLPDVRGGRAVLGADDPAAALVVDRADHRLAADRAAGRW